MREAWRSLIGRVPWQLAITVTNRGDVSELMLQKQFRAAINALGRRMYGRRWNKRVPEFISYAFVTERTKQEVPHIHALLWFHADVPNQLIIDSAFARIRWKVGFIRVERVDHEKGAINYLVKDVCRGSEVELSKYFPRS